MYRRYSLSLVEQQRHHELDSEWESFTYLLISATENKQRRQINRLSSSSLDLTSQLNIKVLIKRGLKWKERVETRKGNEFDHGTNGIDN